MKSLYVLPNYELVDPSRIIDHEGFCRPEQLASVGDPLNCRASPPPGICLMAGVGLERDIWVLFGGLKFAWRQAKGI